MLIALVLVLALLFALNTQLLAQRTPGGSSTHSEVLVQMHHTFDSSQETYVELRNALLPVETLQVQTQLLLTRCCYLPCCCCCYHLPPLLLAAPPAAAAATICACCCYLPLLLLSAPAPRTALLVTLLRLLVTLALPCSCPCCCYCLLLMSLEQRQVTIFRRHKRATI